MDKFVKLTGVAAPLPLRNIDTDMIIPKQFLKTIKRTGLGKSLFFEMRFTQDGVEVPDFVLNKPAYRKAEILVAGDNFGCGSSREHAPWALLDFGIRCVISTSFADIFYNNSFKNGILPITVSQEDLDKLMDACLKVHKDWSARIKTRDLNDWLQYTTQKHPPPAPDGELAALLDSRRPAVVALIGLVGIGLIAWLMVLKPF